MNPNQVNVSIELKNAEETPQQTDDDRDNFHAEQPLCRICYGTAFDDGDLIEPCLCKGTIAKVHRKCLEKWLNRRGSTKCEMCRFKLQCCQRLRYGLFESIGVWFRCHPHRQLLLQDLSVAFAINIIALSMIIMLLRNIFILFTIESFIDGLPRLYFVLLGLTLSTWIGIYIVLCSIILSAQVRPWYRWWKSQKQIQLAVVN